MLGVVRTALRGAQRGVMSSKRGNVGYYKGRGSRSTGIVTRRGHFIPDPYKRVQFIVPDLSSCDLKPYVSYKTPFVKGIKPQIADLLGPTEDQQSK